MYESAPDWDTAEPFAPEPPPRAKPKGGRGKGEKAARVFPLEFYSEIKVEHRRDDLIHDLLGNTSMVGIFGAPNCGKSSLMLDMGLHIAAGMDYRGRKVNPGLVIYCVLEGGRGFRKRVQAWRLTHGVVAEIPFAIIATSINLLDPEADVPTLIATIKAAEERAGCKCVLVVIDTLSRALAGGNENASEDMGALVRSCDRIREACGAAVAAVHHSGKDQTKGARGSSVLLGAVDTEMEVSRDEGAKTGTIRCTKQRDMDIPADMHFRLHGVEVGRDEDEQPITAVVALESAEGSGINRAKLSTSQALGLKALEEALIEHGQYINSVDIPINTKCVSVDQWRDMAIKRAVIDKSDKGRQAWRRLRNELRLKGRVAFSDPYVWEVRAAP